MSEVPFELGYGILQYDGEDEDILATLSVEYHKFLDVLWLPGSLSTLSEGQILVINRFREERFGKDPQFSKANRSRASFIRVVNVLGPRFVVEVGCGKFPILPALGNTEFLGIEIDEEAVNWCNAQGYDVRLVSNVDISARADMILASYVFHFSISDDLLSCLTRIVTDDVVVVFNLIADSTEHVMEMLGRLSMTWPLTRVIKEQSMPRREFWVVMSGLSGANRLELAVGELRSSWLEGTGV